MNTKFKSVWFNRSGKKIGETETAGNYVSARMIMALGAQRVDVVQMVIGRGAKLAVAGVVIGIAGALGARS